MLSRVADVTPWHHPALPVILRAEILDDPHQCRDGTGVSKIARVRVPLRLALFTLPPQRVDHSLEFLDPVHADMVSPPLPLPLPRLAE